MTTDGPEEEKPRVVSRGGALLVRNKPIFSKDGKNVLCCCDTDVKVYSVNTGKCIGILKGHTDFVTGVALHPTNPLQVYTSSLDETILLWDYKDCVKLKSYNVGFRVVTFLLSADINSHVTAYAVCQMPEREYNVKEVLLPVDHRAKSVTSQVVIDRVSRGPNTLALGCQTSYIAAIDNRKIVIYRPGKDSTKTLETRNHLLFTCLASHPTDVCLASGCEDGSIVIWWNFIKTSKNSIVQSSFHHWHTLPVLSLAFTTQGSYLLSGGYESVLVLWQNDLHCKDFMPRLGAPLCHVSVSPDNTHYVTAHEDNMIQIISSNLKIRQIVQGLTRGYLTRPIKDQKDDRGGQSVFPKTGLHLDPVSKALVLNGRPGHLQFYKLQTDEQIFNLDIIQQNYVSGTSINSPTIHTQIDACALSEAGDWLVTAQSRDDHVTTVEVCIKFWRFDDKRQTYCLNTMVEMPHPTSIAALQFRPGRYNDDQMVVSTSSSDGQFKLWTLRDDTDIYRTNSCWGCESVGFYRNQSVGPADFCLDGTLLAVAFNDVITLWNPDDNALKNTLDCYNEIRHVMFGCKDCSQCLLVATRKFLLMWDIRSLSVKWCIPLEVTVLTRDPTSANFAVFTRRNEVQEVIVFFPGVDEPRPLFRKANISRNDVISAIFIPETTSSHHKWMADSRLYFIDSDQKLLTFTYEEEDLNSVTVERLDQSSLAESALSLALKTSRGVSSNKKQDLEKLQAMPTSAAKKLLETAPHVLPSVSGLCNNFLTSLLLTADKHGPKPSPNDDSDSDSDDESTNEMDSDDDVTTVKKDVAMDSIVAIDTNVTKEIKNQAHLPNLNVDEFSWLKNAFT